MRKVLLLVLALLMAATAAAQDTPATTPEAGAAGGESAAADAVASGLNNPRHLFYGSDGTLYVAEAGIGGTEEGEGPYGPAPFGETAQITAVSPDGEQTVLIDNLYSLDAGFGQIEGPMSIYVTDDSYWLVLGIGPRDVAEGKYVEGVAQISRDSMEVEQFFDLRAFEAENNPDQGEEIVSNPADIDVSDDGVIYVADASANAVYTLGADGSVELFASWPVSADSAQSVPTSVSVGADGDVYVGFLSGFPFEPGSARIERYSAEGELEHTYEGLTLVTDVHVADDGQLYAVEMAGGFGDAGFMPDTGRVVMVAEDGTVTAVAEGLNFPYGFAQDANGSWVVTLNSAFVAPDSGLVVPVAAGAASAGY